MPDLLRIPKLHELGLKDEDEFAYHVGVNQGIQVALRAVDKFVEYGHQVDEITLGRYKEFIKEEFNLSERVTYE